MTTRKWKYVIVFPNDPEYKGMDHYWNNNKLVSDLNDATEYEFHIAARRVLKFQAMEYFRKHGKGYLKPVIEKCHTKITIEKSIMGKLIKISKAEREAKEKEEALYEEQDL